MAVLIALAFAVFLFVLASALIWISIRLRRRHGRPWLRDYTNYLAAFYLTAFSNEVLPLLISSFLILDTRRYIGLFLILHLFVAIPSYIGAFFFFNRFMAGFSESKIPRGFPVAYFIGAGGFIAVLVAFLIRSFQTGRINDFWLKVESLSAAPAFIFFFLCPAVMAFRARNLKDRARVRAVTAFMIVHASGMTIFGLLYFLVRANVAHDLVRYFINIPTLFILARYADRQLRPDDGIEEEKTDVEPGLGRFGITKREMEIIRLVCLGKGNRDIAQELFITTQTVKQHLYKIFQKMGIRNRVQLANAVRSAAPRRNDRETVRDDSPRT